MLVVGVAAGFAIGRAGETSPTQTAVVAARRRNAARTGGDVRRSNRPTSSRPASRSRRRSTARTPAACPAQEKDAATQGGEHLRALVDEAKSRAQQFGYTAEQLAGTTISVRDTAFIDESHAVVHFTMSIPGHGPILADRVGYAVHTGGRWKVALRTVCDLLSLDGLGRTCPPAP